MRRSLWLKTTRERKQQGRCGEQHVHEPTSQDHTIFSLEKTSSITEPRLGSIPRPWSVTFQQGLGDGTSISSLGKVLKTKTTPDRQRHRDLQDRDEQWAYPLTINISQLCCSKCACTEPQTSDFHWITWIFHWITWPGAVQSSFRCSSGTLLVFEIQRVNFPLNFLNYLELFKSHWSSIIPTLIQTGTVWITKPQGKAATEAELSSLSAFQEQNNTSYPLLFARKSKYIKTSRHRLGINANAQGCCSSQHNSLIFCEWYPIDKNKAMDSGSVYKD